MLRGRYFFSFLVLFSVLFLFTDVEASRNIPSLSGPVIDEQGLLSEEQKLGLDSLIRSMLPEAQAQVWIVPSLEDEAIESLSIRAVDKWKLGTEKKDNGVLILLAYQDRAIRIEVGQGLEGDIPDAMAGRIIDQILKPYFREGNFYEGLQVALARIGTLAGAKIDTSKLPADRPKDEQFPFWLIFPILFFFGPFIGGLIIFILRALGFPIKNSSSSWSSWGGGGGFGGFGGGGGGGWSGGGGGFSGGGSSGRW